MSVKEPRFLIIDLHRKQAVPATTDEMQPLVWREELTGEAYFEQKNTGESNGFRTGVSSVEGRGQGCS